MASSERVRLAIVGGRRGADYRLSIEAFGDRVELTAICALSEATLAKWREVHPGIRTFNSYDELVESDACTAVLLATPMPLHAPQAIQALRAGKDVLTEVIAATSLDECWELVEAVARSGRVFMMAENYCYTRIHLQVLDLVERGIFGEISYAEGGYLHDTRHLALSKDGELTWRGELRRLKGNTYPTHSLGPVAQWVGAVHGGRDRLSTLASWVASSHHQREYARELLGPGHPSARDELWSGGDPATTVLQTEKGAVIVLRRDSSSPRPSQMFHFELQGSKAAFVSGRHEKEDPLIWIAGQSPGEAQWESFWACASRREDPRWRRWEAQAIRAGHGGGDFFVLDDFLAAIQEGKKPAIDVYDAVTWSCVMPLSIASASRGGAPVAIPNFARARP